MLMTTPAFAFSQALSTPRHEAPLEVASLDIGMSPNSSVIRAWETLDLVQAAGSIHGAFNESSVVGTHGEWGVVGTAGRKTILRQFGDRLRR